MRTEHKNVWDPFLESHAIERNEYVLLTVKMKLSYKIALIVTCLAFGVLLLMLLFEKLGLHENWPEWVSHISTFCFVMAFAGGIFCALTQKGDPEDVIRDQFGQLFHPVALSLGVGHRHFIKPQPVSLKRGKSNFEERFKEIRTKFDIVTAQKEHYPKIPDWQVTALAKELLQEPKKYPTVMFADPNEATILDNLEEFMWSSVAIGTPLNPIISIWGKFETKPFWLALEGFKDNFRRPDLSETDMSLQNLSQTDMSSNQTSSVGFLMGFPLERDTKIEAMLTGDIKIMKLKNDKDLESIEFNDLFKVNLIKGSEPKLYRSLTPATQTSLMKLHKDYSTEAYIKGDQLFLRGLIGIDYDNKDKESLQRQHRVLEANLRSVLYQSQQLIKYIE